jgi:hypothetical protein
MSLLLLTGLVTMTGIAVCISHDRKGYWSEAIAADDPDWLHMLESNDSWSKTTTQMP